jgi:uncharacterized protein YndB with AHSA1/START domain
MAPPESVTASAGDVVRVRMPIEADVDTVWSYMSDPVRFASWIGAFAGGPPLPGTRIDPTVGGKLRVEFPNTSGAACGEFLEIVERSKIVFTFGYDDGAYGMPAGSTTVELRLTETAGGCLVELIHRGIPSADARAGHSGGWTHYLTMLVLRATDAQHAARLPERCDAWIQSWNAADEDERLALLSHACTPVVAFRSQFARTDSVDALRQHISGGRRHMPGVVVVADGDPQSLHGYVRLRWRLERADAGVLIRGVSFIRLAADSRFAGIVSFSE